MTYILRIIIITILGFVILACEPGEKDNRVDKGKKIRDGKIVKLKKGDKVLFGIGRVKGIRNHSLARITAGNRARAKIVQTGKTIISRLVREYKASHRKKMDVNPLLQRLNKAAMADIGIITNKYIPNKRIWYSLARLDLADFLENIAGLKQVDPKIRDYIRRNALRVYTELEKKNPNQKKSIRKIFGKDAKQFTSMGDRHLNEPNPDPGLFYIHVSLHPPFARPPGTTGFLHFYCNWIMSSGIIIN